METTARHSPTPSPLALLLVRWVALAAAFAFTAWILNGVDITGGFWAYVWVALIFGVVNAIIGTILRILTLPLQPAHAGPHLAPHHGRAALDHGRADGPPDDRRLLLDDDLGGHHPRHRGGGGRADPAADLLEGAGRRGVAARQSSRVPPTGRTRTSTSGASSAAAFSNSATGARRKSRVDFRAVIG